MLLASRRKVGSAFVSIAHSFATSAYSNSFAVPHRVSSSWFTACTSMPSLTYLLSLASFARLWLPPAEKIVCMPRRKSSRCGKEP